MKHIITHTILALASSLHAGTPTEWSVTRNENIRWKIPLPETGQSTVTVHRDRIFFTILKPVEEDAELGQHLIAYCCDAETGKTRWTREIKGRHPLRLSGCFSDSSAPPPVCEGERVCFFNASGTIACFDLKGTAIWEREAIPVGRSQPFLVGKNVVYTRQTYLPEKGHFSHAHKEAPRGEWTQLQALNMADGHIAWTSSCGVNMGAVPSLQQLDSQPVILVGRGGGHSPPEKPEGVSLVDGRNGNTLWTLPLQGFMSTMTMHLHGDQALVFHDEEHLWIDARTGAITRRVSITREVPVLRWEGDTYVKRTESFGSKKRNIIQQGNMLAGNYHYFRSYTRPYLGRVDLHSGKVEQLQLPVQLQRATNRADDVLVWEEPPSARGKAKPVNNWGILNEVKNARGHVVMGDKRSRFNGWGHHASGLMSVIGEHLYIPIMSGTVYVIDWDAPALNGDAVVAINDLGPAGQSWNRAALSQHADTLFAHTIREVICIGK